MDALFSADPSLGPLLNTLYGEQILLVSPIPKRALVPCEKNFTEACISKFIETWSTDRSNEHVPVVLPLSAFTSVPAMFTYADELSKHFTVVYDKPSFLG